MCADHLETEVKFRFCPSRSAILHYQQLRVMWCSHSADHTGSHRVLELCFPVLATCGYFDLNSLNKIENSVLQSLWLHTNQMLSDYERLEACVWDSAATGHCHHHRKVLTAASSWNLAWIVPNPEHFWNLPGFLPQ